MSSESKSCNNDLPEHLRKDTALILSVVLGYSAFPGGLLVGGINGLIRGMFLSRGDIFQIFACGIYAGATGAEHAIQKGFYNGASAAINSGKIWFKRIILVFDFDMKLHKSNHDYPTILYLNCR